MRHEKPDPKVRLFSPEEAQRLLPKLAPLFADALRLWNDINRIPLPPVSSSAEFKTYTESGSPEWEELKEKGVTICRLLEQLSDYGIEITELDQRTIHFPVLRNYEIVYYCWRLGEDKIAYFHPEECRCALRLPLPETEVK